MSSVGECYSLAENAKLRKEHNMLGGSGGLRKYVNAADTGRLCGL